MTEHRVELDDGRTVAGFEVGDPRGFPVLYFHGYPGSRLDVRLGENEAQRSGVRLIGLDRPGWGASDPSPGRTLADWAGDVAAFADRLGCARFNVIGVSGGGPFALACASRLPDRIPFAGIVCGLGPQAARRRGDGMTLHVRVGLTLAARTPWLVRPLITLARPVLKSLARFALRYMTKHASPPDRVVLGEAPVRALVRNSFEEAFARGGAGAIEDGLIYGRDWGLDLGAITVPVCFWHGDRDFVVPHSMARWLAERIPGAALDLRENEGHFSIAIRHFESLFAVVASRR